MFYAIITRQSSRIMTNCRCFSLFIGSCRQKEKSTANFTPVYKFPYILPFSFVNKVKLYQTGLTVTSIPGMAILNQMNYVSSDTLLVTTLLGVTGCITLYSLGFLTNKFIGFIYYDEESDIVRVAYIDFWGKRKDTDIPLKDIVPFSEMPILPMDGLFLTVRRYSNKETFKLNIKFGTILNSEIIKKIL